MTVKELVEKAESEIMFRVSVEGETVAEFASEYKNSIADEILDMEFSTFAVTSTFGKKPMLTIYATPVVSSEGDSDSSNEYTDEEQDDEN